MCKSTILSKTKQVLEKRRCCTKMWRAPISKGFPLSLDRNMRGTGMTTNHTDLPWKTLEQRGALDWWLCLVEEQQNTKSQPTIKSILKQSFLTLFILNSHLGACSCSLLKVLLSVINWFTHVFEMGLFIRQVVFVFLKSLFFYSSSHR